ncbi:MAG: cation-translocating P-type ATPase, partial [Betaproteobacteria bacterium]|nr:cation-translocating P-type ATPase [Betaproteobacteria bacterium]
MYFHEWHYKNMGVINLHIEGMTCSACSSRIERVLSRLPGVTAEVSLLEHRAQITGLSLDDAIAAVRRAGYDARPLGPNRDGQKRTIGQNHLSHHQTPAGIEAFRLRFSVIALAIMLIEMSSMLIGEHGWIPAPLQFALASVMQTVVAWPFYQSALRAARVGSANMETLISIGSLAAFFGSIAAMAGGLTQGEGHGALYFETSVIVLAMVRIGKTLEEHARGQALSAIEKLTRLDANAVAVFDTETGQWIEQPPEQIGRGSQIRLLPNQPISLDAVITEGDTEVDESSMTGESMPVVKHIGDSIYAGCTNLSGTITAIVSCDFSQSRRAQLGEKMLSALASRAPIGALADRIAAVFVPLVLITAVLTFFGHLFFGQPASMAISSAIAVLVVACPCALGLATPAA